MFLANDHTPLTEISFSSREQRAVPGMPPVRKGHWLVAAGAVLFLHDFQGNSAPVYKLDWPTKQSQRVVGLPEWRPGLLPGLAVSPDGKEVLWVYPARIEEIWIGEGLA
jgi:hypothetical protein